MTFYKIFVILFTESEVNKMSKKLIGQKKLEKGMERVFYYYTNVDLPMKLDADFYYHTEKEKVFFSLLVSERSDRCFKTFINRNYQFEVSSDIELFVISVLHEIGHHKTIFKMPDYVYNFSEDEENRIHAELKKNDTDEIYSRYFYLPAEIIATDWAMKWVKKHPKKFKALAEEVQSLLNDFYAKNTK